MPAHLSAPIQISGTARWVLKEYPGKLRGILGLPSNILLIASHSPILAISGAIGAFNNLVLIKWADQKTNTHDTRPDPQQWPLWKRIITPWRCPWDTTGAMAFPLIGAVAASSIQTGLPHEIFMAIGGSLGLCLMMIREREPTTPRMNYISQNTWQNLMGSLTRLNDWVRARPVRASSYVFMSTNIAMVIGGMAHDDPLLAASGGWALIVNYVMSLAKKRLQPIASNPA